MTRREWRLFRPGETLSSASWPAMGRPEVGEAVRLDGETFVIYQVETMRAGRLLAWLVRLRSPDELSVAMHPDQWRSILEALEGDPELRTELRNRLRLEWTRRRAA